MSRSKGEDIGRVPAQCQGSILIVSLWIILMLSVIALSLGMRASLEAKIARFYHERVQSRALTRAGIHLGMFVIENDRDTRVDSRNDTWYNPTVFMKALNVDTFDGVDIVIRDEEARININAASEKVLRALFEYCDEQDLLRTSDIDDRIADILQFRGDGAINGGTSLGKDYESRPFWNIEDVTLLEHFDTNDLAALRALITVFPYKNNELKVNINTANAEIIDILLAGAVSDDNTRETLGSALNNYLATSDEEGRNRYFTKKHLSAYALLDEVGLSREVKLVSLAVQFLRNITVDSHYFSITSQLRDTHRYSVFAIVGPQQKTTGEAGIENLDSSDLVVLTWREK